MEYVLWGRPAGQTDALYDQPLTTRPTQRECELIQKVAAKDGWHSFKIARLAVPALAVTHSQPNGRKPREIEMIDARTVFDEQISRETNPNRIAKLELLREFFCNEQFRIQLADHVWNVTHACCGDAACYNHDSGVQCAAFKK